MQNTRLSSIRLVLIEGVAASVSGGQLMYSSTNGDICYVPTCSPMLTSNSHHSWQSFYLALTL